MRLSPPLFFVSALLLASLLYAPSASAELHGLEQAHSLYNRTDYAGAIAALRDAPQDAPTLELLGKCFFWQGDYRKATETLEKAVALDPSDSVIYMWLGRAYGRRAETSFPVMALGYAQRTRESFEKAVQLDGRNGEAINDLFEFYLQAPAIVGGGSEKARNLIPAIGQIDPVEIHFANARIAEEKKQYDLAEAAYRKALGLSPKQVGRVLDLARFVAKRGRYEEAEQLFDRAEKLAPNSPRILFARAQSYVRTQRRLDQAQAMLKKYLASNTLTPDDPAKSEAQKLLKKAQGV